MSDFHWVLLALQNGVNRPGETKNVKKECLRRTAKTEHHVGKKTTVQK